MITRFEVDGFKSLRNFAVDLEPLTVFVGPNGAGKSNLLEAIALLGRLASMPVEEAFKKGRGRVLDQFSRFGGETSRSIRFGVEFSLPTAIADAKKNPLLTEYRYELIIERRARVSSIEVLVVVDERLLVKRDSVADGEPAMIFHSMQKGSPYGNAQLVVVDVTDEWTLPASVTVLFSPIDDILGIHKFVVAQIRSTFSGFHITHLDAVRLREPTERISSGILAPDASNLAAVLADLPAPILGAIRADLVSLIPGLSGFDIVADGDSLRIDFKLSGGDVLPARLASDGTLRALALLTVLTVEPHRAMISIEEPENGIYPGRLRRLLTILRELALTEKKTQVLLTTHSPVVIATFRDKPELLRVVDIVLRDGKRDTRARPVGKPNKQSDAAAVASIREVDALLHAADVEAAE